MSAGEVSRLEPQDAPPQPEGCPRCLATGMVVRIPETASRGWLLPAPWPDTPWGRRRTITLIMGGGTVLAGKVMIQSWSGSGGSALVTWMPFAAFGLGTAAGALGLIGIRRRHKRVRAGWSAALAVWNEGWFCGRCGVVYFQPGYEPAGVGLCQPLSLEQFQTVVYRAGGYEDLAGERRA